MFQQDILENPPQTKKEEEVDKKQELFIRFVPYSIVYIRLICEWFVSNKKYRSSENNSGKKTHRSKKEEDTAKENKHKYPDKEQEDVLEGIEREVHERKVHEEIIDYRMAGGAPPDPKAFAHVLKQWQQLPGSVVRPPTGVRPPAQKLQKSPDARPESTSTSDDIDNKDRQL